MSQPSCPDWAALSLVTREASDADDARDSRDSRDSNNVGDAVATAAAARWEAALRHLDSGCQDCRRQALAADPTLVFRRLPRFELDPAAEAAEVAAARQAVAAMRTASDHLPARAGLAPRGAAALGALRSLASRSVLRSLHSLRTPRSARSPHPLRALRPLRWSLAAGLAGMALLVGSDHAAWRHAGGVAVATAGSAGATLATAASSPAGAARLAASPDLLPAAAGRRLVGMAGRGGMPVALPAADRSAIDGFNRPGARVYQLDGPHMSVVMIVDDKLDV